ncbi:hypothetical protein [Scardovia wiggsiae]|uniref:hypothetical protein n=1 Tax=Scardovia wiggsiae TaxID=230143 RepID=UPI00374E2575
MAGFLAVVLLVFGIGTVGFAAVLQYRRHEAQEYHQRVQRSLGVQSGSTWIYLNKYKGGAFEPDDPPGSNPDAEFKEFVYKCGGSYTCTGFSFTAKVRPYYLKAALEQYSKEAQGKDIPTIRKIEDSVGHPAYVFAPYDYSSGTPKSGPPASVKSFLSWLAQPPKLIYTYDSPNGSHKKGDEVPEGQFKNNWSCIKNLFPGTRFAK